MVQNESTHDLTVGISSLDRTSSESGKPTTSQSGFYRDKKGFTLVELMVVISIIAILAVIGAVVFGKVTERSRVVAVIQQVQTLKQAITSYHSLTDQYPQLCQLNCNNPTDPFNQYLAYSLATYQHSWKGHIGFLPDIDFDADGNMDYAIVLDDDLPGTDGNNNQGLIPTSSLLEIDKSLDDGNLATGNVRGDGLGFTAAVGELVILVKF